MVDSGKKKWLTPAEQVAHAKTKGIRFDLISAEEASDYLTENNNYFRIRSYRTNFPKICDGPQKGKYENLDFKMLIDLSIIDMLLRNQLLPMTLDIEHFSKVKLLGKIERHGEDGYGVVSEFIATGNSDDGQRNTIKEEIDRGKHSSYTANLIARHSNYDYPVWEFLETISFGTFLQFYRFCSMRFEDKNLLDDFYLLQCVKSMRNACAHNNCVLNNIVQGTSMYRPRDVVKRALSNVGISKSQNNSKMRIDVFQQIATTMYIHSVLSSDGVKQHRAKSLQEFRERMFKHSDYYDHNDQIMSAFQFIDKLIIGWYSYQEPACEEDEILKTNDRDHLQRFEASDNISAQ